MSSGAIRPLRPGDDLHTALFDDNLLAYATDRQREVVLQCRPYFTPTGRHTYQSLCADAGLGSTALSQHIRRLRRHAAVMGYSPQEDAAGLAAPGFRVKAKSIYTKDPITGHGKWVKTTEDKAERERLARAFAEELAKDVQGLATPAQKPSAPSSDLLTVIPMGDPHFGLMAWAPETGEDFSLAEADRRTRAAIDRLAQSTPETDTAVLLNLGDFFHADDSRNQTPASGHALDVDSRYMKIFQTGVQCMRHCIERLRQRHRKVIVKNLPGNHDPHTALTLSVCLGAYYEGQDDVEVDLSPSLYWYYRFGKNLIGAHHGHGAKLGDLVEIMPADKPKEWGETEHRYWYCGHIHHKSAKESRGGIVVETFRTLAGTDAWHAGQGYRAKKDMQAIILHTDFGEIERHTCALTMIQEAA